MRNGEWGMRSGECGMGSGEWGMRNGECGMGNAEWGMGNGKTSRLYIRDHPRHPWFINLENPAVSVA